ncbi:MAG: Glycosyltransferase [Candidatus Magasanikbacteria bacterium GW2011_GWC2_37_14]|uniref:Glycosyltransferase n=1 Tax=Candidatus Magasanikbacteria bacterium GW2011_GWC2_37_14 TaxID=1619046 RepID=A0A0G0GD32_9BACT|nr:MAG: Glycosyltransferase [Candidatus Magasanikbacteria bacterium GW2011_GWC2_37_14]
MNLLLITQKIDKDDPILGFFHRWVEEFAKHCKKITVICLQKGEYNLPDNVKVLSLGKPAQGWPALGWEKYLGKLKALVNFYKYIWQERKNYDSVFVHMNHFYVILGGLLWKLLGKKVGLWYAHGHVPPTLKLVEKLSNIIFTSTVSGFRLPSNKLKVIGQGIDTDFFIPNYNLTKQNNDLILISVGRISVIKNYETIVEALDVLYNKQGITKLKLILVGEASVGAEDYERKIREFIVNKNLSVVVDFVGALPNYQIVEYLQKADLFLNSSLTGSLDKAMVEAMACALPVLTCNESMQEVLGGYQDLLMFPKKDSQKLASLISSFLNKSLEERIELGLALRQLVVEKHNLKDFIVKILSQY